MQVEDRETVPLGEVVEYLGEKYMAKVNRSCDGCAFTYGTPECFKFPSFCGSMSRDDGKTVIWVKVKE